MTALWDGLVAEAVLGTERRPYTPPPVAGELGQLVAGGSILDGASAVWAYEEVGRRPAAAGTQETAAAVAGPAPAAPDDRPLLPAGPVRSLAAIVAEPPLRGVLGEWLGLAAADGRRLPPEWIPVLLDLAPLERRPQLEAAAGPRGGWLAAQRADWASGGTSPRAAGLARAVLAGSEPVWEASDEDRLAAFRVVREADPVAGRRLAERVWPDEPPPTRAAMVAGFASGLSMDDEPFLEDRLDDRRKEVRLAAAALLARLPPSRYGRRMGARARAGVRVGGRGRTRPAVTVAPPPEVDRAGRRDGVTATSANPEQWALQVVAAAPLEEWPDPDGLVEAASRRGAGALLSAWVLAADRQGNAGWARRLLAAGAAPTAGLFYVFLADELETAILAWLGGTHLGQAVDVLTALPAPWPAAVTDAVMAALAGIVVSGDQSAAAVAVRDALARFALSADAGRAGSVAAVAGALERLPDERRPAARLFWGRAVTSLNALVHFRQAMQQEFEQR